MRPAPLAAPHGAPARRDVRVLQLEVEAALQQAIEGRDPQALVDALELASPTDDAAALLRDLRIDTVGELIGVLRLLLGSAAYASLSWSRGLPTSGGHTFAADDVRLAAWLSLRSEESDDAADDPGATEGVGEPRADAQDRGAA